MKRLLFVLFFALLLVPVALWAMQDSPAARVEITGVNPADLPTIVVNAAVYDRLGQPIFALTADNFAISGPLAEQARIVSVENVTDDQLAFAVVLAIDTSSSMTGLPLDRAREAAIQFINSIGPNDPVAIITFDSNVELVQDYTTDKEVLLNAIESLQAGGKTALYRGVLEAVTKASESPTPRRAVIVLSDGADFGSISGVERGAALDEAIIRGVPVYTIGLGYGIDRTYLQETSGGTNARFNESPNPDQLISIYSDLASTLRSQYIITINADVPGDGSEYGLTLEVTIPDGTASADTTVRVPIIVPIVSLPDLPTEPITEPVTVTAEVQADDPITTAMFRLDGVAAGSFTEPPYTITLDPLTLRPGQHTLSFSATDESGGGVGQASGTFEVAALPSEVTIVGLPAGEIAEPQTVTLDVTGQTPATSAAFRIDDGEATVTEAPYLFTIDPAALAPGEHTLTVDVENEGGVTSTVTQPFRVAALPPQITISGLESQQEIGEPVEVTINATGQTPVSSVLVTVNNAVVADVPEAPATVTIDPAEFSPGRNLFTATVTLESGQSDAASVEVMVAALPPTITITGIQPGETLDENHTVTVEAGGQTPITGVTFALDGVEVATEQTAPYTFELDVLALAPGAHILTVTAANAGGQTTSADVAFMIAEAPSLTATASALPTGTPTATRTPLPTATLTVTADASATAEQAALIAGQATGTAEALAADAQATQNARATNAAATVEVSPTAPVQAAISSNATATARARSAQATSDARATANAMATDNAEATLGIEMTATLAAHASATQDAQATARAAALQATQDAQGTANALAEQATQDAAGTLAAAAEQATQQADDATATALAAATRAAAATTTQQAAALAADATTNAQATRDADATQNAAATATANAQATLDSQATRDAAATATANAQATLDADATLSAQVTAEPTAEATQAAPTGAPTAIAQVIASPTATESRTEETPNPTMTPIGTLTIETVPGATAASTDILPIILIVILLVIALIILFLFLRGRRTRNG